MSCATNKQTATDNFDADGFESSASNIQMSERTQSTNNTCTLTTVRGKIQLDITSYTAGSCVVYFKVNALTTDSSNNPPVTANGTYIQALAATMGQVNTSEYYANSTPTFTAANDCAGDKTYGWELVDQVGVVTPTWTYRL